MVQLLQQIVFFRHRFQIHHRQVAAFAEGVFLVEHVGDAAGHAGREVAARPAEHHDDTAGHVFVAVVADAFDNRQGAGVADCEALARDAADVSLTLGRTVENGVARDDRMIGVGRALGIGLDDDLAARQALADIVVDVALKVEGHAAR